MKPGRKPIEDAIKLQVKIPRHKLKEFREFVKQLQKSKEI